MRVWEKAETLVALLAILALVLPLVLVVSPTQALKFKCFSEWGLVV